MIEVEHLNKVYGSTPAIRDVTFSVGVGEILGLLGPNGAGKTTTMRILTGYLPATSGTARIVGYEVHEQPMEVRQRIGYLPETPPLYPEMTVEGYLHFVARIKHVPAGERSPRVQSAMRRCGLLERRDTIIRKLSKGYRQRIGIAQAIVHDPPVIILDEPTVGLDPRQIIEVRNLIKSLAGSHTIILSTHILPEVSMTCSRIAIINRGEVVTPDQLDERLKQGRGYELEVAGEVERIRSQLTGLTHVNKVAIAPLPDRPPGRYKISVETEAETEPGRDIATLVIGAGLDLYEMRRIRVSLEDIFLQLTTTERSADATSEEIEDGETEA